MNILIKTHGVNTNSKNNTQSSYYVTLPQLSDAILVEDYLVNHYHSNHLTMIWSWTEDMSKVKATGSHWWLHCYEEARDGKQNFMFLASPERLIREFPFIAARIYQAYWFTLLSSRQSYEEVSTRHSDEDELYQLVNVNVAGLKYQVLTILTSYDRQVFPEKILSTRDMLNMREARLSKTKAYAFTGTEPFSRMWDQAGAYGHRTVDSLAVLGYCTRLIDAMEHSSVYYYDVARFAKSSRLNCDEKQLARALNLHVALREAFSFERNLEQKFNFHSNLNAMVLPLRTTLIDSLKFYTTKTLEYHNRDGQMVLEVNDVED